MLTQLVEVMSRSDAHESSNVATIVFKSWSDPSLNLAMLFVNEETP